jgi:hypothetical protein
MNDTLERYRTLLNLFEAIGVHRQLADFLAALERGLASIVAFDGIGVSLYDEEQQTGQLYLLQTGIPSDIPIGPGVPGR